MSNEYVRVNKLAYQCLVYESIRYQTIVSELLAEKFPDSDWLFPSEIDAEMRTSYYDSMVHPDDRKNKPTEMGSGD